MKILIATVVVVGLVLFAAYLTCRPLPPTSMPASPDQERELRDDLAERRAMGLAPPAPTTEPTTAPTTMPDVGG